MHPTSSPLWMSFGMRPSANRWTCPRNLKHRWPTSVYIYTTKIDEFVCPPNISETVSVIIMKLAHRPRIALKTIKLIPKPNLLSILSIVLKTIQQIGAGPKRKLSPPLILFVHGDSADSVGFRFVDNLVLPSGRSICIILLYVGEGTTLTAN